jgi:hypothetical protein
LRNMVALFRVKQGLTVINVHTKRVWITVVGLLEKVIDCFFCFLRDEDFGVYEGIALWDNLKKKKKKKKKNVSVLNINVTRFALPCRMMFRGPWCGSNEKMRSSRSAGLGDIYPSRINFYGTSRLAPPRVRNDAKSLGTVVMISTMLGIA